MGQVATTPTPLTPAQALGALLAAGCPQAGLLMVAGQSAMETAAWGSKTGKGFNNYNFGNVTPTPTQIAAGIAWMNQNLPMKYIAYADPIAGAAGMLAWLQMKSALAKAAAGDLAGYMQVLQSGCYLGCVGKTDPTGHTVSQTDYDNYQAGIASYMKTLAKVTPVAPPMPGSSVLPALVALGIVITGASVAYGIYKHEAPWKIVLEAIL